jgi:protein-arginine kinase activator protein McsA
MNPPKECQCCGFEGAELKPYQVGFPTDREVWYCDLCAGTEVSNQSRTQSSPPETRLLKTLCYIGNAVLLQMRDQSNQLHHIEQALLELRRQ